MPLTIHRYLFVGEGFQVPFDIGAKNMVSPQDHRHDQLLKYNNGFKPDAIPRGDTIWTTTRGCLHIVG